jgi:hypothetical protein
MFVGVVALALLLMRRVPVPQAFVLAVAAGVVTFVWYFVLLLVALAIAGPEL